MTTGRHTWKVWSVVVPGKSRKKVTKPLQSTVEVMDWCQTITVDLRIFSLSHSEFRCEVHKFISEFASRFVNKDCDWPLNSTNSHVWFNVKSLDYMWKSKWSKFTCEFLFTCENSLLPNSHVNLYYRAKIHITLHVKIHMSTFTSFHI